MFNLENQTRTELIAEIRRLQASETASCMKGRHALPELQAHQAELEVRSRELYETKKKLEEVQKRYSALFDYAPVGYLVLDRDGCILEINRRGAAMLGQTPAALVGQLFSHYLAARFVQSFCCHLQQVFAGGASVVSELRVEGNAKGLCDVLLETVLIEPDAGERSTCRTAMTDLSGVHLSSGKEITERRQADGELKQSCQALRELTAHREILLEDEKACLAREIHDELGQILTALRTDMSLFLIHIGDGAPESRERIESMKLLIDHAIQVVRHVASRLRPYALNLGIVSALEWMAGDFLNRTGIICRFVRVDHEMQLDGEREIAIFRIIQEALSNVASHAGAGRVQLSLWDDGNGVNAQVEDNGRGFDIDTLSGRKSFGLLGIKERALMLGGRAEIRSTLGKGTVVQAHIPHAPIS
ncbi:MAG: ATP-binding protein [Sulfuricella sp.]